MRNMHVTALMGEFDWGQANNTYETTTPNAKKTMSWRWDCKWEGGENVFPHAGESREVRGHDAAQLNRTANLRQDPLLLWWFFGGPLLCTNSKNRAERKYRRKVITRWGKTVSREMFFKGWEASGSKCALCKNKPFPSSAGSESFTLLLKSQEFIRLSYTLEMSRNLPNSKTNLFSSQTIQITSSKR